MIGHDKIDYASLTDVGVRRSHNQDAHDELLALDEDKWRERGHVFVVADGMGAHAVGEMASDLAVKNVPHNYFKHIQQGAVPALRKAFIETNASIYTKGQQNREFEGMAQFEPISREHLGFVDILHVGRSDDDAFFYYVMELADDIVPRASFEPAAYAPKTLRSELQRVSRLPAEEVVALGLSLTAALAEQRRFLNPGDHVGFLGIGSGLNCLMLGLEW